MRRLQREPCQLLLDPGRSTVDFRRQSHVEEWLASHRPRVVFLTAGRVGGIHTNDTFPADFLYDNLLMEGQYHPCRTSHWCREAFVLRLVLHLSARGASADPRGGIADGAFGASQRSLRDRQDRRHQALPSLPEPARRRFHIGDGLAYRGREPRSFQFGLREACSSFQVMDPRMLGVAPHPHRGGPRML
jgi:hypothetical protein